MIVDRRSLHAHRTTRWRQLSQNLETSSGTRMMNCITPIGLMHRASPVTPLRLCCILVYVGHSVFVATITVLYIKVGNITGIHREGLVEQQYGRRRTVLPLSSLVLGILLWYANCLLKFLPMANRLNTNEAALCKLQ